MFTFTPGGRGTLSTSRKRQRPNGSVSSSEKASKPESSDCTFCGQVPAAVTVHIPMVGRKKRAPTPYCLTCYYTTSAVRHNPSKYVSVFNQTQLDEQLPAMQQLFSEAYVELHKELQEESTRAFSKQKSDPLALLHHGGMAPKRMTHRVAAPKPIQVKKKAGNATDGGFLKAVPLPERLLRTQQEQARLQQAQIARMNQASTASQARNLTANSKLYHRRRPARASIWNMAMDTNIVTKSTAKEGQVTEDAVPTNHYVPKCTSCGSENVHSFGNVTSRNQDLKKGETWGMKDRGDDVVARYQCGGCGRTWNEEE